MIVGVCPCVSACYSSGSVVYKPLQSSLIVRLYSTCYSEAAACDCGTDWASDEEPTRNNCPCRTSHQRPLACGMEYVCQTTPAETRVSGRSRCASGCTACNHGERDECRTACSNNSETDSNGCDRADHCTHH